ncbi:hypothetical protein JCM18918_2556 [Cutibacterium acnes JCM 18918]|nr:hypothetical protein JCM18918_2556 [Cutibacterium acnes JCM 18918]
MIVVVGVLGSYLIHEIGTGWPCRSHLRMPKLAGSRPCCESPLSFAVAHPREQSRSMRLPAP